MSAARLGQWPVGCAAPGESTARSANAAVSRASCFCAAGLNFANSVRPASAAEVRPSYLMPRSATAAVAAFVAADPTGMLVVTASTALRTSSGPSILRTPPLTSSMRTPSAITPGPRAFALSINSTKVSSILASVSALLDAISRRSSVRFDWVATKPATTAARTVATGAAIATMTVVQFTSSTRRHDSVRLTVLVGRIVTALDSETFEGRVTRGLIGFYERHVRGRGVLKRSSRCVVPDEVIERTRGYFPAR